MDEKDYVLNFGLLRTVGLHRAMNPSTAGAEVDGFHAAIAFLILVQLSASASQLVGAYYLLQSGQIAQFTFNLGCSMNFVFACWKVSVIMRHSRATWACCTGVAAGPDALAYRGYDRALFRAWRRRSVTLTYAYVIVSVCAFMSWCLWPFLMQDKTLTIQRPNDARGHAVYRMNTYNMFIGIVSDRRYNDHFVEFYFVEFVYASCYTYFTILFDLLMLVFAFALYYRLEIINDAVQRLANRRRSTTTKTDDSSQTKNKVLLKTPRDVYDDLKLIIMDHQHLLKKLEEYLNTFKLTFLIHIFVSSTSHVVIVYVALLGFVFGGSVEDSILATKLLISFPVFIFQLLMTCYLFGSIAEKKESIIFALYSCGWTEMDLKSKRLILFAMKLNNANQVKLKFTKTKTVNLEVFASTIRMCYSITSMLSNYYLKQKK